MGTGKSNSVLDLIKAFEKVNKVRINYEFKSRRDGDIERSLANTDKMIETLKWKPERNIEDMCRDGWRWQKRLNNL